MGGITMGSGSNRNPLGGFYTLEWEAEPSTIAGVKVLKNTSNKRSNDLPAYSNSSNMYFKRDASGEIVQLRVYDESSHGAILDIDINPSKPHENKDGSIIPAGVTHVHTWKKNAKGKLVRNKKGEYLSDEQIKKYGDKIRAANSSVRFK